MAFVIACKKNYFHGVRDAQTDRCLKNEVSNWSKMTSYNANEKIRHVKVQFK